MNGKTQKEAQRTAEAGSGGAACTIERGRAQDAEDIYALYHSLIDMPYGTWNEDYPDFELVQEDLARSEVFVMRDRGRLIAAIVNEDSDEFDGMAPWYDDVSRWAQLGRLGVDRAYQGRGIGRTMMRYALERAKEEGCDAARLLVGVHNLPAQRAYSTLGFDVCGEAEAWGNRWLCYQKRL